MSSPADAAAAVPLPAEDARALTRLMRRVLGRGFRLVVIEVDTPRRRREVIEWLASMSADFDGEVSEVDVRALARQNLWAELRERLDGQVLDRTILTLHGFQEAEHGRPDPRAGVYRQLNVQRDIFVRDIGCFWVVLIHPEGSRKLQDIAPDFCDFSSLWVRLPGRALEREAWLSLGPSGLGGLGVEADVQRPTTGPAARLMEVEAALRDSQYGMARDLLSQFELGDYSPELTGKALRLRSSLELAEGHVDVAHATAKRALDWSEARASADPSSSQRELAASLHQLGILTNEKGRPQDARALHERALELTERSHHASNPSLADFHAGLGLTLLELGQFSAAQERFERTLELLESTGAAPRTISALYGLAMAAMGQGALEAAGVALERARELVTERFARAPNGLEVVVERALAQLANLREDHEQARAHIERALEVQRGLFGEGHPTDASLLMILGSILYRQDRLEEARAVLERGLELFEDLLGSEEHPTVAVTLALLAGVSEEQGDAAGARALLERSLVIHERVYGTLDHRLAEPVFFNLARVLASQGQLAEAESTFERALELARDIYGPDHVETCMTEASLADLLLARGGRARARNLAEHAHPILLEHLGPDSDWVIDLEALLAMTK